MAAVVTEEKIAQFELLFRTPTLAGMLSLDPSDFEHFVAYVFTCAGYTVEYIANAHFPYGPGVDLNLYPSLGAKKPIARVEVKRYAAGNKVSYEEVKGFNGVLHHGEPMPGYFVTTSDFHPHAAKFAQEAHGKLRLLNGTQFQRYITYLRGSRVSDPNGLQRTPVLTPPDWLYDVPPPLHCDPKRTTVLTIANNKGGVAKTTSVLNLGLALAQRGERVLLVDMDGQASLSSALPLPLPLPDAKPKPPKNAPVNAPVPLREHFISQYFTGQVPHLADLVQPTRFPGVFLLPANDELHRLDTGGGAHTATELAFVRDLHSADLTTPAVAAGGEAVPFDWILLDTPPAQSFFTRLALAAAHYVLIPIHVEAFGTYGINRALATADTMRALVGTGVTVVGCLPTQWKETKGSKAALGKLQTDLPVLHTRLFLQAIPYHDAIEQAHQTTIGGGIKNLFGFANNAAAVAYNAALDELMKEVRPNVHQPR